MTGRRRNVKSARLDECLPGVAGRAGTTPVPVTAWSASAVARTSAAAQRGAEGAEVRGSANDS